MSKYKFDVVEATNGCIGWIRKWFEENGDGCKAIVGISGGKDSTVVAKLCVEALGKERVVGIMMPNISSSLLASTQNAVDALLYESESKRSISENNAIVDKFVSAMSALNDGYKVCKYLGIEHHVININEAYSSILSRVGTILGVDAVSEQTKINLSPRLRMTTLYAVAQSMNGRVANTSNASELYVGYGTRWGDTVGDFAPIANFTCTEVKKIGNVFCMPSEFINRTPDDGLCGKSDEENFGFTYAALDNYIRTKEPFSMALTMDVMHSTSEFKRQPIASYEYKGE